MTKIAPVNMMSCHVALAGFHLVHMRLVLSRHMPATLSSEVLCKHTLVFFNVQSLSFFLLHGFFWLRPARASTDEAKKRSTCEL